MPALLDYFIAEGAALLAICTPLSLAVAAYERTLVPLYAEVPTRYLLNKAVLVAIALAVFLNSKFTTNNAILLAGVLLSAAPTTSYWAAVLTARSLRDPVLGPLFTHLVVICPIVYVCANLLHGFPRSKHKSFMTTIRNCVVRVGGSYLLTTKFLVRLWSLSFVNSISNNNIFFYLAGLVLIVWMTRYSRIPLKQTYPVPVIFVVALLLPLFLQSYHSKTPPYAHPSFPLRILSSTQSLTGLIVVGEGVPFNGAKDGDLLYPIRYLRASHSILGGVWTSNAVSASQNLPFTVDEHDTRLGDSIYSTFVLQEATRLVNSTGKDKWENALVIGLGTGISASAFIQHNLSTTVVEIDPAVYSAARSFFGMPNPGPGNVFLEDARGWVERRRQSGDVLFDIVVHDCFSGGGVPKHLFTTEFWEGLKSLMHEKGVVAVNFAGKVRSDASRGILATLEENFTQCRAFHDSFEELTIEKFETEFVNMVFFCTLSRRSLTFRQDREDDYLGSPLRKHILTSLRSREIDLSSIRAESIVLTDKYNPLDKWQEGQAFEHWRLMRQVLPDVFWETY